MSGSPYLYVGRCPEGFQLELGDDSTARYSFPVLVNSCEVPLGVESGSVFETNYYTLEQFGLDWFDQQVPNWGDMIDLLWVLVEKKATGKF